MALRIWPGDYERKEHITREERLLLRNALQSISDGHFVIGIDPVGMSTDTVHMGFYIAPDQGLLTFSVYTDPINPNLNEIYKSYVEMAERKIHERLLDSMMLIVRDGERKFLKFPYRHAIIFANERPSASAARNAAIEPLAAYAYVHFLHTAGKKKTAEKGPDLRIADGCRVAFDPDFQSLSEQECAAIFERLAPEYVVVMHEKEHVEVKQKEAALTEQDFRITGRETEYRTFFLDEYQVGLINDMGRGHRVILANPGAGKSVLLLSKAFKYASLYKDSKVLLTCFNNNLADSYLFKRRCADFGNNRNLYIMTLHKLVKRLFEECLHKRCNSNIATPEEIQECLDKVRSGEITMRFKAVFIDEVQIFEPIYLELCYALLEKSDDHTFLMAGDLNQTVRSQSRRGDAPWKKIRGVRLDFTGRVRYIEKNYRNSRQIGDFLNRMLCYMNQYMEKLEMISLKEFSYDSFEPGKREGITPNIQTGASRTQIRTAVLEAVKEIVGKYQVGYSDIAILFPMKKNAALNYPFLRWITSALDQEGIPYSLITSAEDEGHTKVPYSQTTGVVLSTIDASLGLDFKAVIVAGLYPYNYYFTDTGYKRLIKSWEQIGALGRGRQEKVQIQMRKLYTACSRARDILYVVSDLKPGSPMEQLLIKAKENEYVQSL